MAWLRKFDPLSTDPQEPEETCYAHSPSAHEEGRDQHDRDSSGSTTVYHYHSPPAPVVTISGDTPAVCNMPFCNAAPVFFLTGRMVGWMVVVALTPPPEGKCLLPGLCWVCPCASRERRVCLAFFHILFSTSSDAVAWAGSRFEVSFEASWNLRASLPFRLGKLGSDEPGNGALNVIEKFCATAGGWGHLWMVGNRISFSLQTAASCFRPAFVVPTLGSGYLCTLKHRHQTPGMMWIKAIYSTAL